MDKLTPEQRHRCMAAIKGKDTKPECQLRHIYGNDRKVTNYEIPEEDSYMMAAEKMEEYEGE